jgi:hypothetical protein
MDTGIVFALVMAVLFIGEKHEWWLRDKLETRDGLSA